MYYNKLSDYLKSEYGCKVYKLSLSAKVTCPNRDGTCGEKGCIFCSDFGSGEFSENAELPVFEQIEKAKLRVNKKIKDGKYIAYFQSFTNTYGDIEYLEKTFLEAINHPDIVILSIATRPDCLGEEVLYMLKRLNAIKPVWVELGLQTSNDKTARYIRRGYKTEVYSKAVKKLKSIGIKVITHMIIGLPKESEEDIIETARFIGRTGTDGIKLHLLHILKGTDIEMKFLNGSFTTLSIDEYVKILGECIKVLPKSMVIHRLTGDGDKKALIAPLWSADKKRVLNKVNEFFKVNNIEQGSNFTK